MHYSYTHKSFIKTLIFGAVGAGCIASHGIIPAIGYVTFEAVAALAVMGKALSKTGKLNLKYGLPSMLSHQYHHAILKNSAKQIVKNIKVSKGPIRDEAIFIAQIILSHTVNNYFPDVMAHFDEEEAIKSKPHFSVDKFIEIHPDLYTSVFDACDKYLAKNEMSIKALAFNTFYTPLQEYIKKSGSYKLSDLDYQCLEYFMGNKKSLNYATSQALGSNKELITFMVNNISIIAKHRGTDPQTLLNQLPQLMHTDFFEKTIPLLLLDNREKVNFLVGYFKCINEAFTKEAKLMVDDYHRAIEEKGQLDMAVMVRPDANNIKVASTGSRHNKI